MLLCLTHPTAITLLSPAGHLTRAHVDSQCLSAGWKRHRETGSPSTENWKGRRWARLLADDSSADEAGADPGKQHNPAGPVLHLKHDHSSATQLSGLWTTSKEMTELDQGEHLSSHWQCGLLPRVGQDFCGGYIVSRCQSPTG